MINDDKLIFILEVINYLPGKKIIGRKKLHKLVYLLQEKEGKDDYKFDFYNYGVFSFPLAHNFLYLKNENLLNEEEKKENNYYKTYSISLTKKAMKSIKGKNLATENEKFLEQLSREKSHLLEVLSTIVYLDRKGYKNKELLNTLTDLKGHLHKDFDKAFKLAGEYFGIERPKKNLNLF